MLRMTFVPSGQYIYSNSILSFTVSKQKRTPVPVVIVSYMRSGTTLMSAILEKHPDVFSIFEPLHALKRVMENNESLTFLDGRTM